MYIVPPKTISITVTSIIIKKYWNESSFSNDKFARRPYQWSVVLSISPQYHSWQKSATPYQYNGNDVNVGDWVCTGVNGRAHKIISITDQSQYSVTAIIEDIDRYNTVNDVMKQGDGSPKLSYGFICEIGVDGLPIITPSSGNLYPYSYVTDMKARFEYRNYIKNNIRIYQENNNLSVGDVIYMDTDGLYKPIQANKDNRNNLEKIVGTITDISIPGEGYFTYSPRGEYIVNLDNPLPDAEPGSLIYVDPNDPGKLTATKPKIYSTPVYIRLNSSVECIYLMGGSGSGGSSGPLGYNASVYTVDTIDQRDGIDTTLLNPGDQVYVKSGTNGVWEIYIASSIDQTQTIPVVSWTKYSDEFSSQSASGTIQQQITYQTSTPIEFINVKTGVRILNIVVAVTEIFSSDSTFSIGDDLENNRLVDNNDIDLTVIGNYTIIPNYVYSSTTMIKGFLSAVASSTGKITITISYL